MFSSFSTTALGMCASTIEREFCPINWTLSGDISRKLLIASANSLLFPGVNKIPLYLFFTISGMPVASGQYWNSIHGREPGEALQDIEGLQGMRTLAHNMAFLMKSILLGKEQYGIPQKEPYQPMNFIR